MPKKTGARVRFLTHPFSATPALRRRPIFAGPARRRSWPSIIGRVRPALFFLP